MMKHNITVVCVDTVNSVQAIQCLEYNMNIFPFKKAILFSDIDFAPSDKISFVKIPKINIQGYNHFTLKELYKYIDTDFCLIIQTDGFIINPQKWQSEFLNYDYIGAPLPDYETWLMQQPGGFQIKWKENNFTINKWPQNGGFSLRSKKLLKASAECPFPVNDIAEDNYINVYQREWFEMKGLKFAPQELAYEFSVENPLKNYNYDFNNCFGFHGKQTRKHLELIQNINQQKSQFSILNKLLNISEKLSLKEYLHLTWKNRNLLLGRNDFFRLYRDYNYCKKLVNDSTPIDALICCLEKDEETLPKCIESLRKHLKHPISNIYIVAPGDSLKIKEVAKILECIFIDETSILDIKKEDINYHVKGNDRSGWIFQQLIKLHADKISSSDNIFVIDADTILIKPKTLIYKAQAIFDFSDEYHYPYFQALKHLYKFETISPVSFVSHMMTFSRSILVQLRKEISIHNNKPFIQSILEILDENENSCFSEFELYGNFYINNSRNFIFKYWNNQSLNRQNFSALDFYAKLFEPSGTESLSFHHYEEK